MVFPFQSEQLKKYVFYYSILIETTLYKVFILIFLYKSTHFIDEEPENYIDFKNVTAKEKINH